MYQTLEALSEAFSKLAISPLSKESQDLKEYCAYLGLYKFHEVGFLVRYAEDLLPTREGQSKGQAICISIMSVAVQLCREKADLTDPKIDGLLANAAYAGLILGKSYYKKAKSAPPDKQANLFNKAFNCFYHLFSLCMERIASDSELDDPLYMLTEALHYLKKLHAKNYGPVIPGQDHLLWEIDLTALVIAVAGAHKEVKDKNKIREMKYRSKMSEHQFGEFIVAGNEYAHSIKDFFVRSHYDREIFLDAMHAYHSDVAEYLDRQTPTPPHVSAAFSGYLFVKMMKDFGPAAEAFLRNHAVDREVTKALKAFFMGIGSDREVRGGSDGYNTASATGLAPGSLGVGAAHGGAGASKDSRKDSRKDSAFQAVRDW